MEAGNRSGYHDLVRERTRILAACAVTTALLAVMSWVALPLPVSPVPVTLQTLGVYLAGGLLGPRWGAVAVVAYLLLGLCGVPVFAGAEAGPGVFVGPKGGYLVGFLPAAAVAGVGVGIVRGRLRGALELAGLALVLLPATVAIYIAGTAWLMVVAGLNVGQAALVGFVPFLPGEALKLAAAVALLRALNSRVRRPVTRAS